MQLPNKVLAGRVWAGWLVATALALLPGAGWANMAAPLQTGTAAVAPSGWPAGAQCRNAQWLLDLRMLGQPGDTLAQLQLQYSGVAAGAVLRAWGATHGQAVAQVDGAPLSLADAATEASLAGLLPAGPFADDAREEMSGALGHARAARVWSAQLPALAAEAAAVPQTLHWTLPLQPLRYSAAVARPAFGAALRWRPAQPCSGAERAALRVLLPTGWTADAGLALQRTAQDPAGHDVWEGALGPDAPDALLVVARGPEVPSWLEDLPLLGGLLACGLMVWMGSWLGGQLRRRGRSVGAAVAAMAVLGGFAGLIGALGVAGGSALAGELAGPPLSARWFPNSYGAIFAMFAAAPLASLGVWLAALLGWRRAGQQPRGPV